MTEIAFRPGSNGMPGYLPSTRRIVKYQDLRGAWNSLDLFDARAAEDFLKEKLERISDDQYIRNIALDIIFGFGVLAVEAEREERRYMQEVNTVAATMPEKTQETSVFAEEEKNDDAIPW